MIIKYLLPFVFLFPSIICCQNHLDFAKNRLFSKISNLDQLEGIYNVESVQIYRTNCKEIEVNLNKKVSIIKNNEKIEVTDLENGELIGTIQEKYDNGFTGKLVTTGLSQFPDCDIRPLFWYAECPEKEDFHSFLNRHIKIALKTINNSCFCEPIFREVGYPEMCNNKLVYRLEKIFPNKNEPPPNPVSIGTGVIITSDGFVITNRHVVDKPKYTWDVHPGKWVKHTSTEEGSWYHADTSIQVFPFISTNIETTINGTVYSLAPVDIIYKSNTINATNGDPVYKRIDFQDFEEDLMLLKIINYPESFNTTIIDTSEMTLGTEIYTLGFPFAGSIGSQLVYTNGYYSNSNYVYDIYNLGINPGNSGGGIFNKKTGHLVGIATAKPNQDKLGVVPEGLAFSTRLNNICKFANNTNFYFGVCELKILPKGKDKYINYWYSQNYTNKLSNNGFKINTKTIQPIIETTSNQKATIIIISN